MTDIREQFTPFIDGEEIARRISELAAQIDADLAGKKPTMVVALKGGATFAMDLLRALETEMPVVYAMPRKKDGECRFSKSDKKLVKGRDLIVVDGLLDSGGSAGRMVDYLEGLKPASLVLAVLLHKTVSDAMDLPVRYLAFEVPDVRLVGYGLDEGQLYRGLPGILTWPRTGEELVEDEDE